MNRFGHAASLERKRSGFGRICRGSHSRHYTTAHVLLLVAAALLPAPAGAAGNAEGSIGVNKYDLVLQYFGTASGGDGGPAFRRVTQAMAQKAIMDAKHSGIRYFRISATGYAPSGFGLRGDLDLWRSDRTAYWQVVDRMMDDLARNGIQVIPSFVWNLRQLPAMTRETVRDLVTDPGSLSYRMLDEYVSEYAVRYRTHPALLFYEIGNELNLSADLDLVKRCIAAYGRPACEVQGNFSTDEMIAFTRRIAQRIRAFDTSRPISSGHSFPRSSAQHLRRAPEFSAGGPDWTKDSLEDLSAYLEATHAGLEVMSVHIYEGEPLPGFLAPDAVGLVPLSARLARALGKTLFIGEIGGPSTDSAGAGAFLDRALSALGSQPVPYAALWVWQFYQTSTYRSFDHQNTYFNIEPGYSDRLLRRIAALNGTAPAGDRKAKDDVAPTVIITWPLECARVQDSFTVHVAASDDSGVPPRVELSQGERRLPAGDRPPYDIAIDQTAPGEQDLVAVAEDNSGNRAEWRSVVVVGPSGAGGRCRRCCQ
jgi:hypothetical protein